jgi:hypothetical protein
MLCESQPQADHAMECCRKDASRFAAAKVDCCQPDRGENVPAEQLMATRNQNELDPASPVALVTQFWFFDEANSRAILPARGLPEGHPPRPPAVPLLI